MPDGTLKTDVPRSPESLYFWFKRPIPRAVRSNTQAKPTLSCGRDTRSAAICSNLTRMSADLGFRTFPLRIILLLPLLSWAALAQLPDGPGKEVTAKICSQCHEIERAVALKQDRDGWQGTINKMSVLGMQAKPEEIRQVLNYLARSYPADALPKVNVNTADAIDLESAFSLTRSETAALAAYRAKHGKFKSLDDLKNIPGVSFAKFEAHKNRLAF